jgi:hypothetical protein
MNKHIFISIATAFSFSIDAMDIDSKDLASLDAREVARVYRNLIQEEIEKNTNNYIATYQDTKKTEPDLLKDFDVGLSIVPSHWHDSTYIFEHNDINMPSKLKKLFDTLYDHNFIFDFGKINTHRLIFHNEYQKDFKYKPRSATLFHEKLSSQCQRTLTPDLQEDKDINLHILCNKKNASYFYHQQFKGIMLRNNKFKTDKTSFINDNFKILFEEREDLIVLKKKAEEINKNILNRVLIIKQILNENNDHELAIQTLKNHANTPQIISKKIDLKMRQKHGAETTVKKLNIAIDQHINASKELQNALSTVIAAPIDLFLLYTFYLTEDLQIDFWSDDIFTIKQIFSDQDEFSLSNLLAQNAQFVMEKLGIELDEKSETPTTSSPNHQKKKPSKTSNKKKNNNAKKQLKKTKAANSKPVRIEKDDDEDEEEIADESSYTMNVASSTSITAENTSSLAAPKKTKTHHRLTSLNDAQNSNTVTLSLEKGHRMLDTLARLVAAELAFDWEHTAGSVSLVLLPQEEHGGKLVIATRASRANAFLHKSLALIIDKAIKIGTTDEAIALKEISKNQYRQIWQEIEKNSNDPHIKHLLNQTRDLRYTIDLATLSLFLKNPKPDPICASLFKILSSLKDEQIVILENPFNLHSEMVMAEYLRASKKRLGEIPFMQGKVPYQYIGGSLLNCAKCDVLLRGDDTIIGLNRAPKVEMVFFTRGSYNILYPNYLIHRQSCLINNTNRPNLTTRLNQINGVGIDSVPLATRVKIQYSELSDSEDND